MFCFLACLLVLVREMPSRPTKETGSTAAGDAKILFQLKPNAWKENVNLSSLSCGDLRAQTWAYFRHRNQSLTSFPACLPELLEHLDLSVNLLPEFNSQEVADLPMLQFLSLRQNKIQQVTWDARNLSRLQFLDLSYNLLSVVPACNASVLQNLEWFSLAGNPIVEIQPLAFSCYPQLHILNLSSTWLGKDGKEGIKESAFATIFLPGDATENAGSDIHMLDLSATYLERLHQNWTKDLPRLSSLYLRKMGRLSSLDVDTFLHLPELRVLDCRYSRALSLVETESFSHTPHLAFLIFQNCNLSSFSPWSLSSLQNVRIDLYGNPLVCSCDLSWLFSKPDRILLQRASEILCYPEAKAASGGMLLSEFYTECQRQRISNSTQVKLYGTSPSFTTDTLPDSSTFPQEWPSSPSSPQCPHLTWGDTAKEAPTEPDILAYKDKTFGRSTDSPPTAAALHTAASSRTLGELSFDPTPVSMTEMNQRKHDTTVVDGLIGHKDETWSHFTPLSPTAEETAADSSLLIPHNTVRPAQSTPPLQSPTKAVPLLNLATTRNSPRSYEDYYDYDKQAEEFVAQGLGPCDYDPCRHLQKPCFDLQLLSPCLCPGISDEFTIPDPPRLREISEIRDTSAEVCWCAPYSAVRFYQLAYRPQDSQNFTVSGEIYATARRYTLYNLLPGSTYQVCIMASNKAGLSQTADWNEPSSPCGSFKTKSSYKSIFATLCATSGFFLIATILLSVCLCKKCKGPHTEHYNTHLVSYKNPAFDYSLK
ncbi:leucine-rich repeat neuronal protein 4 [Podarcis raffonei]|uniref:leucine-rich repeat neuronal protein 4 n=1 Tax=Podarcis raffonei TaxID=65483 RepID=UPI002329730C|nr:leucine-rich repeat neuronal protein 4 [Podarcis raffonei]XP_053236680.1 leucine-rich repeat neuronal protein 4 [Podarcis raffonei]XP_053236681.1 leucine-rich repeat neuronal protein 4 [Podarcis raffonei]